MLTSRSSCSITHGNSRQHCGWTLAHPMAKTDNIYVNLSAIAMSIGSKMCQALPAYHALYRLHVSDHSKGKGQAVQATGEQQWCPKCPHRNHIGESRCVIWASSVAFWDNSVRSESCWKQFTKLISLYGVREGGRTKCNCKIPRHKLKGVDASSLPPYEAELQQHIHRSAFVAKMWADSRP